MKTILITVDDKFWNDPCFRCPAKGWRACKMTFNTCPLANAKEAVEVKFDIDKETGLSVIDANGRFHFEAQDKYYAVAVDK